MSPWLAPAPSLVTISRRRCFGGSAAIAASSTVRWSAVVLLPAEPGRSIPASGSPVLSHQQPKGCRPNPLKLGSAPALSGWQATTLASSRRQVTPCSTLSATRTPGRAPWRASMAAHARRRAALTALLPRNRGRLLPLPLHLALRHRVRQSRHHGRPGRGAGNRSLARRSAARSGRWMTSAATWTWTGDGAGRGRHWGWPACDQGWGRGPGGDRERGAGGCHPDPARRGERLCDAEQADLPEDRKSTRLNSSHVEISYAVFCLKKKKK